MDHRFQVDLRGIIELLSDHLYSRPDVFLRELLQNGIDAITMRRQTEPEHEGELRIELLNSPGKPAVLNFSDNGAGLTEEEVHKFLATIGASSKRSSKSTARKNDFLGQFGIGLLSCFVVADEIVLITQSIKGGPAIKWVGKSDGSYQLTQLDSNLEVGTQVFLTVREDQQELFEPEKLRTQLSRFGSMLPIPIYFQHQGRTTHINREAPPWQMEFANPEAQRSALLRFGQHVFERTFIDAVRISSKVGQVEGIALILDQSVAPGGKRPHRVYLRGMLLAEEADNLLPDWAFFVQMIVNANDLRPTASRESFYEDKKLDSAREALGEQLRTYLLNLAKTDPQRFNRILSIHELALKSLALEDDDCFAAFKDFFVFETVRGPMTIPQLLAADGMVRYLPSIDQFKQISQVASSQGSNLVNAGYVYSAELLGRYAELHPDIDVQPVDIDGMAEALDELDDDELQQYQALLGFADSVLRPFRCKADIRRYKPDTIPALFLTSEQGRFLRSIEQTQQQTDSLWSGVLGNLRKARASTPQDQLCLNARNPLVQKLRDLDDERAARHALEALFLQSLILARQPLASKELSLLSTSLLGLIGWGLDLKKQAKE